MMKAQVCLQWTTQDILQIVLNQDHLCYEEHNYEKKVKMVLGVGQTFFLLHIFFLQSFATQSTYSKATDEAPLNVFAMQISHLQICSWSKPFFGL
jgi:hypothetical protein